MTNKQGSSFLTPLLHRYELSGNPVYVWTAIGIACDLEQELPEWVINYLRSSAGKMLAAKQTSALETEHVLKSLGFFVGRGKTGWFEAADKQAFSEMLAKDVHRRISAGDKKVYAYEAAAKEHDCSESTVRRAYEKNQWLLTKPGFKES